MLANESDRQDGLFIGTGVADTARTFVISVSSMKSLSCVRNIQESVKTKSGVENMTVDLEGGRVTVTLTPHIIASKA